MGVLLGIDIGTTATKAVALDPVRGVAGSWSRPAVIDSPAPGYAQADPEHWWDNVCAMTRELGELPVDGVAVTGMVPTVIPVDDDGRALTPSIQQNDVRAHEEIAELAERSASLDVLAVTGAPVSAQSVGPKLRWLARHAPAALEAARWVVGSYDFVAARLTGRVTTETNWALESGLWELASGAWSELMVTAAGVDRDLLPTVLASGALIGTVTASAAAATGLRAGTPVFTGGADHVLSALAAGITEPGQVLVKIGGAGDILAVSGEPIVDERLFLDLHPAPGRYVPNGCMAASGSAIRWFAEQLAAGTALPDLDAAAAAVPAGADGVVFLPYLLGEKTPVNDPSARGAFVGLYLGAGRGVLYRAVLEGIAYGFRQHVDVLAQRGLPAGSVRVSDGGARSRVFAGIVSDVLGLPVERLGPHQSSALGAAYVAGMGTGAFTDWADVERLVDVVDRIDPEPAHEAAYAVGFGVYSALYPALRGIRPPGGRL
ncbi:FGGY-family carbohydrate kinase [Jiangella asiatica]|uniref:Carbohydrate kinase n=1 Tax=Jiangella asiatica TaxID=2530372 RepID=A0A4V2Z4E8_9ACTN|nr:FGGY family carbohydrate kinase [Jiangella asiatica]TDE15868.1 carbohydrate kinase [Jiangella asiatica]